MSMDRRQDLHDVLARLYASEINVSISTEWDGGWDVKLGDRLNGFKAETTIPAGRTFGLATAELQREALGEVAKWLHAAACEFFPDSDYARTPWAPWCCQIDCSELAIFEVVAVRHAGGDELGVVVAATAAAGPDPYGDFTHACEDHVGALLGFQPEAVERGNIFWQVRTLAPVMLSP